MKLEKLELVDISTSYDIADSGSDRVISKLFAVIFEELTVGAFGKVKANSGVEYSVDRFGCKV